MTTAYEVVLDALRANGKTVIERGDRAQAQCPAHDDNTPSLSIGMRKDSKGVVLHCQAGCDHRDVLEAIGLLPRDLFDDTGMRNAYSPTNTYKYSDGRRVHRKPNKDFPSPATPKGGRCSVSSTSAPQNWCTWWRGRRMS
jgi:hypothetical protein